MEFSQSIDGKSLPIYLLLGLGRGTRSVHHPVQPAVFLIQKMLQQVTVGPFGHTQVLRRPIGPVSCRKGPENSRIKHQALLGSGNHLHLIVNLPDEPAVLLIQRMLHPEAKDIVLQLILKCAQPRFSCYCHVVTFTPHYLFWM
ncbi:hypothetical protein D3C71_1765050 [compost metagenome]